jgi:hypothetical protein
MRHEKKHFTCRAAWIRSGGPHKRFCRKVLWIRRVPVVRTQTAR